MAAIFQRKYERKFIVDDTEPLNATIESSHTVDGHTEYVLRVQRGLVKENSWLVHRRYNDFVALHKHLSTAGLPLPLPAKKLFGNLQPEFVAQRLNGLQQYLDVVLMNPILASSLTTRRFVDPEQYNQSFADLAIQNASLCLRNDGQYVLGASLGAIGWRLRKHYFRVQPKTGTGSRASGDYVKTGGKHVLVKSGSQTQTSSSSGAHTSTTHTTTTASSSNGGGKTAGTSSASHSSTSSGSGGPSGSSLATEQPATDLCLTWTEYGPDKYVDDRETQSIVKSLMAAHHPYVARIEYATANDSGALVVRRFAPHGSVKDQLCNAQPRQAFLHKYGNPNGRKALPLSDVALWSRQILEALRWLHERGMPNGHVHAGNVLVVDGRAKLLDVENFVLGVPAFYRPFFMQHSKIFTTECIDVYSFGHLVFEMAMGYALQESTARQSIECGAASLRSLLDSILSREACRVGLPTLEQLAAHPFFTEFAPQFPKEFAAAVAQQKPTLKLSTTAKEQLRLATQRTELRLQNEQKSTKNQKRLVKIQEMMSSEEEKKKTTKHKAKMEQKQSRLRQQNSLQLSGGPPPSTAVPFNRSDSVQGGILSPPPTGKPSTSASQSTSSSVGSASDRNAQPPSMFEPQVIRAEHKDVIHDVVYDYHGQRMATCSSDQTVKVWDQKERGIWTTTASWKAHSGSVWRLSWAHPEFGQVLATCSFDRTVSVWEETVGEKTATPSTPAKRWVRRTNLVDSRTSVTDVKFGPKTQGLLLATCSVDGVIRIYEAPDIMNLSQWTLAYDIACKLPLSCITWNQSLYRLHAPMIAAGSDDASQLPGGGKVFVFEYSVGGNGKWTRTETLAQVTEPVHDISFAPNIGRSYHILAVASKDVQIFNMRPLLESSGSQRFDVQMVARFSDHNCTVWRTAWNVTGTMLASTGDDGYVRMWKMNYQKNWKCAAVLKPDGTPHYERDSHAMSATPPRHLSGPDAGHKSMTAAAASSISVGATAGNGNGNGGNNNTTKYYKRGIISHPNQVPLH